MKEKKTKKLNEGTIAGFLNKFLDNMQQGTQNRFISKAKKRGIPPEVIAKMAEVDKDILELQQLLQEL